MEEGQVTDDNQNQDTTQSTASTPESLGWRAALPDQWKEHEFVKGTTKPSEFVEKAWSIKTERDALQSKMERAIFKPGENATEEEKRAFYSGLGVPEKSNEYEFPKGEGVEHDPKMIEWAQKTFHDAKLTKEQASKVSLAWDSFMDSLDKFQTEAVENELKEAESKLKEKWKSDYGLNLELSKRAFKHFSNTDIGEFQAHPTLVEAFYNIGKAMGEDFAPHGTQSQGNKEAEGIVYNKSPAPPKKE